MADLKTEYEAVQKKYGLPSFEELDAEFDISSIDHKGNIVREIRKRVEDKLEYFVATLEDIFQPDGNSFAHFHECKFFDDSEKEKIFDLYRRMMKILRSALALKLSSTEKEEADFLLQAFSHWKEFKKELSVIVKKLKESWDSEIEKETMQGYFG